MSFRNATILRAIEPIWRRETLFVLFVLFVFTISLFEILAEFAAGETWAEMGDDLLRFAFSAVVLGMFVYAQRAQRRTLSALRGQLNAARGRLAQIDAASPQIAGQYRAVMQKQFDAWRLTSSEQDVVIGMLKGLSFREIAALRDTREKTVRQQASSVYRKSGVAGRNELAAWFFEDLLEPPTAIEG